MADIALLVAEEFERRKNWEKVHQGMRSLERTPETAFRFVASSALSSLGGKLREEAAFLRDRAAALAAAPPESSVASAAFDGLFSA